MDVYSFGESFGTSLNEAFGIKENIVGKADRASAKAASDAAERAGDLISSAVGNKESSTNGVIKHHDGRKPRPGNPPRPPKRPILPGRTRIQPIIVKPMRTQIVEIPKYSYSSNRDLIILLLAITVVLSVTLFLRYK